MHKQHKNKSQQSQQNINAQQEETKFQLLNVEEIQRDVADQLKNKKWINVTTKSPTLTHHPLYQVRPPNPRNVSI